MNNQTTTVKINAKPPDNAMAILHALLTKKHIAGGQTFQAAATLPRKDDVVSMDCFRLGSFTLEKHHLVIIDTVQASLTEEVPMFSFLVIKTKPELANWIKATVS